MIQSDGVPHCIGELAQTAGDRDFIYTKSWEPGEHKLAGEEEPKKERKHEGRGNLGDTRCKLKVTTHDISGMRQSCEMIEWRQNFP